MADTSPPLNPDRCPATAGSTGVQCRRRLGAGTDHPGIGHCSRHGGSTPQYAKHVRKTLIQRDMVALGSPVYADPVQGLLDELAQVLGELAWLREQIILAEGTDPAGGSPGGLFSGRIEVSQSDGPDGTRRTRKAKAGLSTRWQAYQSTRQTYLRMVEVALRYEVEDRQIRVLERAAESMGPAILAALDAAGVTGEAKVVALDAARDSFREMLGGPVVIAEQA